MDVGLNQTAEVLYVNTATFNDGRAAVACMCGTEPETKKGVIHGLGLHLV